MRIMMTGNFGHSWDGSICDEEHIAKALEDAGHTVERRQREGLALTDKFDKFDFCLIAQWGNYPGDMIDKLKAAGNFVVYWAFDYQWAAKESWHLKLAKEANLFLSKEMEHRAEYEAMGCNFHWLPQDFAPMFLTTDWDDRPEKDIDVLFTGSMLSQCPDRTNLLLELDKTFNIEVYSVTADAWKDAGMKHVNGPVMDEELKKLVPRAKVNLSIDLWQSEGYWSDRNAQVMALGGVVLSRYVPMSEIVFRDAIQYFYTPQDCILKLKALLSVSSLEDMEKYAYMFAHSNLMVRDRVQDLLTIVGAYLA